MMTQKHEFQIQRTHWARSAPQLQKIRKQVFVHEQKVPEELEWDNLDDAAEHVLVCDSNGSAIATARLLDTGQIGRMAVLTPYRGRGIGHSMLSLLIETARQKGFSQVFVHAQQSALGFYQKHGFEAEGELFMEANIPHLHMILPL
ncbi:MAG: GNAT family N-acetyltransferase [Gammaproteobacteria bacterium]|nr:GNAT family N-acetyltransferase [Gammaproteobacteria bacterium]MDH5803387.1 GNAT family N-acetyltransferase [Gammaproteobacteria bacterium]